MSADLVFDTCTHGQKSRKLEKDANHARLHFSTRKCSSFSPLRPLTIGLNRCRHDNLHFSGDIRLPLHQSSARPMHKAPVHLCTRACTRKEPVTDMRGFVYFPNTLATFTSNTQGQPISMGGKSIDFLSFFLKYHSTRQTLSLHPCRSLLSCYRHLEPQGSSFWGL